MAINEACQVWIEQRIQEELESREDNKKSLRAIGREIAAEIERVFEAKVNPRALEKRAERKCATNVAPRQPVQRTPRPLPEVQPTATEAWQFAEIAISQLSRIREDDPNRLEAFERVVDWINKQRG